MAVPWRRSARFDPDAVDYFSRIAAAGGGLQNGAYSEKGTRRRLSDFFVSLKDGGLWPSVSEMGVFLGVSGLPACLVKAKYGTGTPLTLTNFNFVAGDHTPTGANCGLKGDGASKYLTTGVNQNSLAQNALSMWVYVTNPLSSAALEAFIGADASNPGIQIFKQATDIVSARISTSTVLNTVFPVSKGVIGFSRSSSSMVDWMVGAGTGSSSSATSAAPGSASISVMARGAVNPTQSTVAIYGFGGTINLAALKSACDSLYAAFGGTPL